MRICLVKGVTRFTLTVRGRAAQKISRNPCLQAREIKGSYINMNTTDHHPSNTSHRELAAGVLKQAENDLRRFHRGTSKVERELYLDAYRWMMSDDCSWPF